MKLTVSEFETLNEALDFFESSAGAFVSYDEEMDLKIRIDKIKSKIEIDYEDE